MERWKTIAWVGVLAAVAEGSASGQADPVGPSLDPEKVVTAERCNACHGAAFDVWQATPHAKGFKTRHRTKRAEEIAGKLGQKLIKRGSICIDCHYTPTVGRRGKLKAVSGVSCESCHGAARDWINVHNDYGDGQTHETESAEHRAERLRLSREAGMLRPSDLYDVVANCYRCHTVPHERLVNVGGHASGSDFELVDWSDRIRHNFLDSFLNGDGTVNAAPSDAQKRVMYVVGLALDLEYALRGLAAATADGTYLKAMHRRSQTAQRRLAAIQSAAPGAGGMLKAAKAVRVAPNRAAEFNRAALEVARLTKDFIARQDGSDLAALDRAIAGEGSGGEEVAPVPTPAAGTTAETASRTPGQAAPAGGPDLPGTVRSHLDAIHPAPSHNAIGATACSKCHGDQSGWWFGHAHYSAAEDFFGQSPRTVQIATTYGITPQAMQARSAICMDCHAGRGAHDLQDGVSCESCHGNGADFKEPHQEDYLAALGLGMVDLKNLTTRAQNCAGCHYITERRLLAAGHPSGADFDFAGAQRSIKHWEGALAGASELNAAYRTVLTARGPVPKVTVVQAAPSPRAPSSRPSRRGGGARRPAPRAVAVARTHVELPPFPAIGDTASVDEVIAILKERLDLLRAKSRGAE